MKLYILTDNTSLTTYEPYLLAEPGLCFYMEVDQQKILLDTGFSDVYIKNAEKMGFDLSDIDTIVFSHGHDDHTWGLPYYFEHFGNKKVNLVAHPDCLIQKYTKDGRACGFPILPEAIKHHLKVTLSTQPKQLSTHLIFLGQIPQYCDFEPRYAMGYMGDLETDDFIYDDSALVYTTPEGIYVITGCSHSGICNIIEHAKKVTGDNRILGVIGGFHLLSLDSRAEQVLTYLENQNIPKLFPCHCTSFQVRAAIENRIGIHEEIGCGFGIEL